VFKTFRRNADPHPIWRERTAAAVTLLTKIGNEIYFKGRRRQIDATARISPPPDLALFHQARR